ncbi:MAG TPA: hypothetical protein VKA68_06630 [bacterium]|nr:hypothetical protein [bacterium]
MVKQPAHTEDLQFVLCIRNDEYPASLERGKVYQVPGDTVSEEQHLIRIIDESGEDYVYPQEFFVEIDLPQAARDALVA